MTIGGWVSIAVSWTAILVLFTFCLSRTLKKKS